ncbi:MAG TPA: helix-turn-helix domain-containing protein [Aquabacterium sp.]|nr:helix-turn-helix domain-containing protein [Aquabacterium sp.]
MPIAPDPAAPRSETDAHPTARWIAPRVALASCVRAYLTRSTLHCAPLPPDQCANRFPAHAYCSLTWFIEGAPVLTAPAGDAWFDRRLPHVVFSGPRSQPLVVRHDGPMQAFTLALYPQAVHALTGLRIAEHLDRFTPVDELLPPPWQALSGQVLAAASDDDRVALIEQFLEPRWQAHRAQPGAGVGGSLGHSVRDWVRAFSGQMLAMAAGHSARHLERRVKGWAGQPLRRLRRLDRAERSFLAARAGLQDGTLSWAEIAAAGGFADQAHLSREMREITGDSPRDWARKVEEDESYWAYRIWS